MSEEAQKFFTMISLDRSRRRWRLGAIVLLAVLTFYSFLNVLGDDSVKPKSDHIAYIEIIGFIGDDVERNDKLQALADDDSVVAVIAHVDSPGGSMVGGLNLYHALKRLAAVKPLVTTMGNTAASAGYMAAMAGEYVIASEATLTASIGVFMPLVNATGLAEKLGLQSIPVSSGDMKTATYPLADRNPAAEAQLQEMVLELQDVFLSYVAQSRKNINPEALKLISDGRVVIGKRAKKLGLVDALGTRQDALNWLYTAKNIAKTTQLKKVKLKEDVNILEEVFTGTASLSSLLPESFVSQGMLALKK